MTKTYDRLVILDFEATCQPGTPPAPQEIIEFPSVLIDLRDGSVVDEFSTFVRPVHHPILSEFCTELTGIRQADVDDAPAFVEVVDRHLGWLKGHGLVDGDDAGAIVTCGDWDLATMLPVQCAASPRSIADLPPVYRRWINIKKIFAKTRRRAKAFGMPSMLRDLGLELVGRHHRGIDDCHNIARIALALAAVGGRFQITSQLAASRYPALDLVLVQGGRREPAVLSKRALPTLLGMASGIFHAQVVEVRTAGGALVDDDALMEMRPGTELEVVSKAGRRPAG